MDSVAFTTNDLDVLKLFGLVDHHVKLHQQLKQLYRNGMFALGQTRYALGSTLLTSLQHDQRKVGAILAIETVFNTDESIPTVKATDKPYITVGKSNSKETLDADADDYEKQLAELINSIPSLDEATQKLLLGKSEYSKYYMLEDRTYLITPSKRRSHKVHEDEDDTKNKSDDEHNQEVEDNKSISSSDEQDDEDDHEAKYLYVDPIKQYGVLVPQSLRIAQSEFKKFVELAVELANCVREISILQEKILSS